MTAPASGIMSQLPLRASRESTIANRPSASRRISADVKPLAERRLDGPGGLVIEGERPQARLRRRRPIR